VFFVPFVVGAVSFFVGGSYNPYRLMAGKIQGILFDLGDTILDFGTVDVLGKFEAGANLAYQYLVELRQPMPSFASFHRRQLWAFRWNYFKSRFTGREFNTLDILGQLCLRMGHDLSQEQMLELAWRFYQPLARQATVEAGTRELLEELTASGLRLGLVSNTFVPGQTLDRHLAESKLLDLLPVRIYSCDAIHRKPSPEIFQMALRQTQLEPGQTLFVGDSLEADIEGANLAGMISVLKDPQDRHRHSKIQPRHRIHHLAELREILRQYNT
jgi:putative hydrolase of the HAD superfamily